MVHRADFGTCGYGEAAVAGDQQAHVSRNAICAEVGSSVSLNSFFLYMTFCLIVGKALAQAALQHARPNSVELSVFTVHIDLGYYSNHTIFYSQVRLE